MSLEAYIGEQRTLNNSEAPQTWNCHNPSHRVVIIGIKINGGVCILHNNGVPVGGCGLNYEQAKARGYAFVNGFRAT